MFCQKVYLNVNWFHLKCWLVLLPIIWVKCCRLIWQFFFSLSGSHDLSAFVNRFVQTFFFHYEYALFYYFHLKIEMLTDRSPLLCDFSMLGNFSPISLVHLPKSLTIKSFSGANLYISQILAKFFSINKKL